MAEIFCGKILHSPSVGSKSPLCVYSSPCTVSYYLNVSIFHCNPHRHSRRCYLLHDRRYLASASSSNRLPSELDIISTAERSDGSVVFKFADASQIVKDVEHLDESEEKLSEETADRRRGADFVGDDTGLKNCSSNSVELAYDDSDQEHSEAVKSDAVEGEGAVDANSESNADVGEDNSMPEFAVSVVKATKISTYSELAQYGGNQEHSEVVESDNVAGRGAMDVKNEPNEKVDQGIGSLELAVSLVGTSRDSEVELAHNDSDRDHSEMVEGNSGMGRGAMDINNELAVSAVEAEGTSSAFEIELVRNDSHLPSEIAESNDGAAKGSMDVKNELDEYTDPNTQISELVVSVVEAEETSVDSSVGLMSAHNFTEGSSGSGENRKADVSLTNILEDVEKSHRPDLNDHIYVAASSDDSVLEDAEVFCSEEASEDITGVQAIMPVASSSDELSAERLGCNESLDGGEQNSSVDTGADMSFLVKDDEADNVTAIMSEHSQSVVGLIPDLESITSDKSQCLVADNSSDILPRKSDVAAEISEFTERSAHKDLGTKSVESTISRGDGHLSDSILHSAAASLRNPSKELGSNRKIGSAKMCSGLYFFQPTKSIVAATSLSSRQYDTTFCHSNSSVNIDSEIMMWHYRLGHPNFLYLRKLFPNLFIDKNPRSFDCEICQLAKHTRSVYLGIPYQPSKPFALVHSDIWGPSRVKNINGARWFVTFVDDHTRLTWVFLMKEKSELTRIFQTFNSMIQNQFGTNIKILRFDNAREYFYSVLGDYLSKHGIVQVSSCVNTPQQNGVAERKNRQLLEVARAIMFSTNVPKYLWGEAVLTSAYLINRLPSRVLQFKTPRNVLINFFPHAQFLSSNLPPKVFGCSAFVHVYSQSRSKLDPQSTECVFIGYSAHKKGYKCFCPITRKMFETMDVTFFENSPYYSNLEIQGENTTNFQPWCWDSILEHNSEFIPSRSISQKQPLSPICGFFPSTLDQPSLPTCSKQPIPQSTTKELLVYSRKNRQTQELVEPNTHLTPVQDFEMDPTPAETHTDGKNDQDTKEISTEGNLELPIALRKGTRTCTQYPIKDFLSYANLSGTYKAFLSKMDEVQIPANIQEALSHPGWKQAVQEEISALEKNGTWIITDLPSGKKAVSCKWIFTVKYKANGNIERLKARLVARGFTQSYGIDYQETFAPVAKLNTIRILLSLAANLEWSLHQLDIKNAFLNGNLEEEVYMEIPSGVQERYDSRKVCKLLKSLYGLKQSPRAWFGRFSKSVKRHGFTQCQADHTLFVKRSSSNKLTVLIVYVDDIILTGDNMDEIARIKQALAEEFEVKDLGPHWYFLGLEVAQSKEGIFVSQRKYTLDLLKETGMLGCRPASTPMDCKKKFAQEEGGVPVEKGRYQRLVGKLIYLSHTRPDISFAVSTVSQFMNNPMEEHMEAVYQILRYLKRTPGKGILFRKTDCQDVTLYSDADWAGSQIDSRSTAGYCSFVWGNLVTWRSKKQSVVSRSSAESELRALAVTICEGIWIRRIMTELGIDFGKNVKLKCDNQAAISMAKDPIHHDRTKHVTIDRHFIAEKIENSEVQVTYIPTREQCVDILTKALPGPNFERLCSKLGMYNIYNPT